MASLLSELEKIEQLNKGGTQALEEQMQEMKIEEKSEQIHKDCAKAEDQEQKQDLNIDEKNEKHIADGAQTKEMLEQEQNLKTDEKSENLIADGAQATEQEQEQTMEVDEKSEQPIADGAQAKEEQEQEQDERGDEKSEDLISDDAQAKEDQEQELRIHEKPFLVKGILQTVKTEFTLDIRKSEIPGAGSGLFAAGEIPEGSTIFTTDPIVACRHPEAKDGCDLCFFQGKSSALHPSGRFKNADDPQFEMMKCSGCRVAQYCSRAHQKMAWKHHHKVECPILKKHGALPGSVHALLRLFLLNKSDELAGPYTLNVLQELETHFQEHNNMESRADDILMAARLVTAEIPAYAAHLDVVWRMYTTLLTNGANMTTAESEIAVGYMFNLGVAMINHKCNPNAFVFTEGSKIILRSLRPIADGEEICVSYVDENLGVMRRKEELASKFIYNCNCKSLIYLRTVPNITITNSFHR